MIIGIFGCANSYSVMNQYNSLQGKHKALAVAIDLYGNKTGGAGWDVGDTIYEARRNAINQCKRYNQRSSCLIEWENNNYVLSKNLTSFRQKSSSKNISTYKPQNIYQELSKGQCATSDCLNRYNIRSLTNGQCDTIECLNRYNIRSLTNGQCDTIECLNRYNISSLSNGQCKTIDCFLKSVPKKPAVTKYYSRYKSNEDDDEEEDAEEYEDDAWFDEGTPQCDKGTYYEKNGYC